MTQSLNQSVRTRMPAVTTIAFLACVCCIACTSGCATWGKKESASSDAELSFLKRISLIGRDKAEKAPEPYPNPVKMATTWTPDTIIQTGRTPTRGFGGRIFFYNEKSQPVPVDGTLIIHGFDEKEESKERKLKRFEFTPEQFTRHFSQSDLGASYSIWVPWDAAGGEQRKISLVASFKPVNGEIVQGIPATIQLPGKKQADTTEQAYSRLSPEYRRYRDATQSGTSRTGLATTTITRRRSEDRQAVPAVDITSTQDRIASGDTKWMDLAPNNRSVPSDSRPRRIGNYPTQAIPASARLPSRH
jgi:hypothetical protein